MWDVNPGLRKRDPNPFRKRYRDSSRGLGVNRDLLGFLAGSRGCLESMGNVSVHYTQQSQAKYIIKYYINIYMFFPVNKK